MKRSVSEFTILVVLFVCLNQPWVLGGQRQSAAFLSNAQELPVYGKIDDIKDFNKVYVHAEDAKAILYGALTFFLPDFPITESTSFQAQTAQGAYLKLVDWPWPGNVRELQNMIERGVILSRGFVLEIPLTELVHSAIPVWSDSNGASTLRAYERGHILEALRDTGWVIGGPAGAAARLGLNRSTLNARMRKLEIRRPQPV